MKGKDKAYIALDDLDVYRLSRELSREGWRIYQELDWKIRKILGDQFIESTDSIGANIAEGYGRFHYLDKVKFYYNARGSLFESEHWMKMLLERKLISEIDFRKCEEIYDNLKLGLNGLIKGVIKAKKEFSLIS